jgi:hypothetical protein
MAFALLVERIHMRVRLDAPVQLHSRFEAEGSGEPSKAAGST